MSSCPVCTANSFSTIVSAELLREECRMREKFVQKRLTRPATDEELKDLTNFFHGETAHMEECTNCGLLVRREHDAPPAEDYSNDEYDPQAIENVYPQYLEAFRAKQNTYRGLLQSGARVVEVGSHYGAFLQTATEWGWEAEGVDVGDDTSRFAKSKGFTVHHAALDECRFATGTFAAVFIWNCYEQMDDPKPTLAEARRLLNAGGSWWYGLQAVRSTRLASGCCEIRDCGLTRKSFCSERWDTTTCSGFLTCSGTARRRWSVRLNRLDFTTRDL